MISAEEMAQGLFKMCGTFTEDLYSNLTPKLQAEGFLCESTEKDAFALDAMQLYIWLTSYVCADDRPVLNVLHNMFTTWDAENFQGRGSQTMQDRFALYTEATHRDLEVRAKGITPTGLATAALQCLLNKPDEMSFGLRIRLELVGRLWSAFPTVEKFRVQFKIREA